MINQNWQPDFIGPLIGGADAGLEPELIGDQQYAYGRNVSVRGGRVHSRPRLIKRSSLPAGKIQGAMIFKDRGVLLVGLGGRVYELDPGSWSTVEKTSDSDCNNPNRPRMYFVETAGSVAIQDGQSAPIIYDGSEFRRAKDDELPVGWMMSFANGRLCVVVDNQKAVRIGDIKGDDHQSEFKFTETNFLVGGGDFFYPEKVEALNSLPIIDTATGQGSTIVGTRGRVFSLKTQVTSRDLWPDVSFGSDVFPSSGILGSRASEPVNQDIFFRAADGLRSFRAAVGDYSGPGLVPLSREVGYRLDCDDGRLLEDCQMNKFDNRLLITHSPINYGNRSIALGLIAYNFDPLSTGGRKNPPVYDGEWDFGLHIAEVVSDQVGGRERCFLICRDPSDGSNGVWELLRETDKNPLVVENPTQEICTRTTGHFSQNELGQKIQDVSLKQLMRCDIWLSEITSDVSLKVFFRPDKYPHWIEWDTFDIEAQRASSWGGNNPIQRFPISTRSAPEIHDTRSGMMLNLGFGFQLRFVWTGVAKINHIAVYTKRISQTGVADNVEGQDPSLYQDAPAGQEDRKFWPRFTRSPLP